MIKVYCVGMIKNEADIIESYVRYHLNIFDGIVLLDNGSTDRTLDILSQLQSEGLPVHVRHDHTLEYVQGEKTTELINYTIDQFDPDFIFPLDVDEFLIAPNYSGNPRDIVNTLPTDKVFYLEREYNYVPINLNENELFIPKRITYASPIEDFWPKVAFSKNVWKTYSLSISGGNHYVLSKKKKVIYRHKKIIFEKLQNLKLRHFPYRSLEHLKSKIAVGWLNTLASYNYKKGFNYHWHELFLELKKNNFNISIEKILEHNEIHVPMDFSFCQSLDLKYTTNNEVNAISNLLDYCESLANNYRNLDKQRHGGS